MAKLAFMHIPKTGGISTEKVILETLDDGPEGLKVCPAYHAPDYRGKSYDDLPGYDFYQGHFRQPFAASLPDDVLKITLVRPPLDLLLSLYNHIASRPAHALHAAANAPGASFASLITAQADLQNIQARYILGHDAYAEICQDSDAPRPKRVAAMLEVARENLKVFDLIGTTPRLGRFVVELGKLVGRDFPAPPRANQNKTITLTRDRMSEADTKAMQEATWADRPLYKMIKTEILDPKYAATPRQTPRKPALSV